MNRSVRLKIRYDRRSGVVALLTLTLLTAVFLGYLAWDQDEATASTMQVPLAATTGMRQYYLTDDTYTATGADGTDGNGAGVCASGYHFASLWEILDPSNLKYDIGRGEKAVDSGAGPPTTKDGWIRTGYSASTSATPGQGNCDGWASNSNGYNGTVAQLPDDWGEYDIHVWEVTNQACDGVKPVWCVEDYGTAASPTYLPIIMKNK
jgi:hypothetical protein